MLDGKGSNVMLKRLELSIPGPVCRLCTKFRAVSCGEGRLMASKEQPLAQTSQEQTGIEIKTKIPRVFDWTK